MSNRVPAAIAAFSIGLWSPLGGASFSQDLLVSQVNDAPIYYQCSGTLERPLPQDTSLITTVLKGQGGNFYVQTADGGWRLFIGNVATNSAGDITFTNSTNQWRDLLGVRMTANSFILVQGHGFSARGMPSGTRLSGTCYYSREWPIGSGSRQPAPSRRSAYADRGCINEGNASIRGDAPRGANDRGIQWRCFDQSQGNWYYCYEGGDYCYWSDGRRRG